MDINNSTILITGATSGIGLEMAKQLSEQGNTVIITGRNVDKMNEVRKNYPKLFVYELEVADINSINQLYKELIREFPKLNVLINNAGLMQSIDFQMARVQGIADEVTTNLTGAIMVTQVFLPQLLKQREGAVLNVTSGIAYFPFEKAPIYSASKLGLHSYTQSLRKQLKGSGIKVFELAPPRTDKPMFSGSDADNEQVDRIPKMPVEKVVQKMIAGMSRNRYLIAPGMSKVLRFLGKIKL